MIETSRGPNIHQKTKNNANHLIHKKKADQIAELNPIKFLPFTGGEGTGVLEVVCRRKLQPTTPDSQRTGAVRLFFVPPPLPLLPNDVLKRNAPISSFLFSFFGPFSL